jgi:hypothetical protein
VHVFSSVTTLLLTVVKIGLHWRWIVNVARQTFQKSKPATLWPNSYQPAPAMLNRRHFLSLMGVVGLASWAAIHNVVSEEDSVRAETLSENSDLAENEQTLISTATSAPIQNKVIPTTVSTQSAALVTPIPTNSAAKATATSTVNKSTLVAPTPTRAATTTAKTACTVRCNKRCAYPGRCRRYVDTNNNKKCDLGECV